MMGSTKNFKLLLYVYKLQVKPFLSQITIFKSLHYTIEGIK